MIKPVAAVVKVANTGTLAHGRSDNRPYGVYAAMTEVVAFNGVLTLAGPAVAIGLALLTKRVLPSLLIAAAVAALVAAQGQVGQGTQLLGTTVLNTVTNADNLMITTFSLAVAATVGVMGRSGGTRAMVQKLERFATGRRGAMVATWLSGGIVFFDDYANCLVVGSSMAPVADRFRISRAKLAYIVDATAAPIASLAVVSTWVGFEVSLFESHLVAAAVDAKPFEVFLQALPYRFYCIFTLIFVATIALTGRDFGPMARAERKALSAPVPQPSDAERITAPAVLGWAPILVLVGLTFWLMMQSGRANLGEAAAGARLFEVLGACDPYPAMLKGSLVAWGTSGVLCLGLRRLGLSELGRASYAGARPVVSALLVLVLAWILGDLIEAAGTGDYLSALLGDEMPLWVLPVATFLLAALTAFSVGSSFFTMGALIPLVMPLSLQLEGGLGPMTLCATAAVLDGAVLGDHSSPISDTTILSAIGSGVDLMVHVQTQLPYVIAVGAIAIACGTIPVGFGWGPWTCIPAGALVAVAVVRLLGRDPRPQAAEA